MNFGGETWLLESILLEDQNEIEIISRCILVAKAVKMGSE